jgi:hypothetical protein
VFWHVGNVSVYVSGPSMFLELSNFVVAKMEAELCAVFSTVAVNCTFSGRADVAGGRVGAAGRWGCRSSGCQFCIA